MSKEVCEAINQIDKGITVNVNNSKAMIEFDNILTEYCIAENEEEKCYPYEVFVNTYFIKLLNYFMNIENLKNNKYTEYATLWLCHKLNKNSQNEISNLNDFHNKYIKGNKEFFEKINDDGAYNSYEDFINKKQDMVNVNIKDMSKFYEALQILCKMYTKIDESKSNCTKCLDDAQKFADEYEKINGNHNDIEGRTYKKILLTLFDDYDNLKKKCDKDQSSNFPTLSPIKTTPNFAQSFEDTSSSSSIAGKIIPVLLTFSISIFLGVAYKYSLFGFDKRFRRQYSREKLKK
ncbi:CIR protein [Plasmodium chabaudi adami]|uniref:CIR protein n=1 Tax=Plasmodium chabaudi adami TaxID=5826 RepID=A0A1C6WY88_PLACE|nr:CIR protein [Plasmodium chabaudi adami]